jgi:hypothetical protein
MFQVCLIDAVVQIELRINEQVVWFFAETGKIVIHEFADCLVEFFLVHIARVFSSAEASAKKYASSFHSYSPPFGFTFWVALFPCLRNIYAYLA